MAYHGSPQDLFASADSDSDSTVNLSAPSGTETHRQNSESMPSSAKQNEVQRSLQQPSKHAISSSESDEDSRYTGNTRVSECLLGHMSEQSAHANSDARTHGSENSNSVAAVCSRPVVIDLSDDRPLCKYGEKCYRRNPSHFQEFRHLGN